MDTDDLSQEAYNAIIVEAENFSHDLTLQYGLLAEYCEDEEEYLCKAKKLTKSIMGYNIAALDDIFFGDIPNLQELKLTLKKILFNIEGVRKIPLEKRHWDFD